MTKTSKEKEGEHQSKSFLNYKAIYWPELVHNELRIMARIYREVKNEKKTFWKSKQLDLRRIITLRGAQ